MSLSLGELLAASSGEQLVSLQRDLAKLRLDLKYERRKRRQLEQALEQERALARSSARNHEHARNLQIHVEKRRPRTADPGKLRAKSSTPGSKSNSVAKSGASSSKGK